MTEARIKPFGALPDGAPVEAIELSNEAGVSARVLTYGATLQSLTAPDRHGNIDDLVLGCDSLEAYLAQRHYFGATIGRYANRIAKAAFPLDGVVHRLEANDGPHGLHGGPHGFHRALWRVRGVENGRRASVTLSHLSPHGAGGYPGQLDVRLVYALDEGGALSMTYEAVTDRPTVVNLTNHSYFDLDGTGDILGHRLSLAADHFTPVDADLIPTGEIRAVEGTPFDFRTPTPIGARLNEAAGYDHNLVLRGGTTAEPRLVAQLEAPRSGRVLQVLTTAPGLQVYSGGFLDGVIGKAGRPYRRFAGLCLEPQRFPDSPNRPAFPSPRLDPGQVYRQASIFRLSNSEEPFP